MTYDEFVDHQLAALSRYALMLTTDPHTAQDLVQETMVRVKERWSKVAAAGSPEAYVRRMLTNLYFDWHRGSWLRRVTLHADPPETTAVSSAGTATLFRPGTGPDHAERAAQRDELWQALAALPRQRRAAVVLRYYEDRTDEEIADILGCSVTAVRSYISKALATLRDQASTIFSTGGYR